MKKNTKDCINDDNYMQSPVKKFVLRSALNPCATIIFPRNEGNEPRMELQLKYENANDLSISCCKHSRLQESNRIQSNDFISHFHGVFIFMPLCWPRVLT